MVEWKLVWPSEFYWVGPDEKWLLKALDLKKDASCEGLFIGMSKFHELYGIKAKIRELFFFFLFLFAFALTQLKMYMSIFLFNADELMLNRDGIGRVQGRGRYIHTYILFKNIVIELISNSLFLMFILVLFIWVLPT